jgi:hypothetical protein
MAIKNSLYQSDLVYISCGSNNFFSLSISPIIDTIQGPLVNLWLQLYHNPKPPCGFDYGLSGVHFQFLTDTLSDLA